MAIVDVTPEARVTRRDEHVSRGLDTKIDLCESLQAIAHLRTARVTDETPPRPSRSVSRAVR